MQLRAVEYLCALAHEQHFARAAQQCGVSQPTLSAGIVALEELLGRRLVVRDRRFIGLTPEGQRVLPIAQQLVATFGAMRHAAEDPGPLSGELRMGVIPAAMPAIGAILQPLRLRHPAVRIAITALTARETERALDAYEFDAAVVYLGTEPLDHVLQVALYTDHHMLVAHRGMAIPPGPMTWADAAALPLCLLPSTMQGRRVLDAQFEAAAAAVVSAKATANSLVGLLSMLGMGGLASILPRTYAAHVASVPTLITRDIVGAAKPPTIGLIVRDRRPLAPLANAALMAAQSYETQMILHTVMPESAISIRPRP